VEDESTQITIPAAPHLRPADADLNRLVEMIDDAKTVAIFGGDGCRYARDEVIELSEKLKAPVGYALRGKQWLEHDNPNAVGMTGLIGYGGAYGAINEAELLLLLGTDFPFSEFLPGHKVKKVQIDKNPKHIGRRTTVDLGLVGDIKTTLNALLDRVQEKSIGASSKSTSRKRTPSTVFCSTTLIKVPGSSPYVRNSWPKTLSDLAADDALFFADTGTAVIWLARHISGGRDRRLFGSFSWASMANASPMLSAHSWHIQGGKRLLSVATAATRCSPLAIS